jgi:hypothetical protein
MTTKEKCDQPAAASVSLDGGEFIPACQKHIDAARDRSAKAGKNPLPKGLNKVQAAQFVGANRDDAIPIHVRPLSQVERESAIGCFVHLIGA